MEEKEIRSYKVQKIEEYQNNVKKLEKGEISWSMIAGALIGAGLCSIAFSIQDGYNLEGFVKACFGLVSLGSSAAVIKENFENIMEKLMYKRFIEEYQRDIEIGDIQAKYETEKTKVK